MTTLEVKRTIFEVNFEDVLVTTYIHNCRTIQPNGKQSTIRRYRHEVYLTSKKPNAWR